MRSNSKQCLQLGLISVPILILVGPRGPGLGISGHYISLCSLSDKHSTLDHSVIHSTGKNVLFKTIKNIKCIILANKKQKNPKKGLYFIFYRSVFGLFFGKKWVCFWSTFLEFWSCFLIGFTDFGVPEGTFGVHEGTLGYLRVLWCT